MKWYAVFTCSRHEVIVEEQLKKKGQSPFLPRIRLKSQRKDRLKLIEQPLFPSYLFTFVEPHYDQFLDVLKCRGVVTILGNKMGPIEVPSQEIESIQILLGSGKTVESVQYVKEGEMVQVVEGALKGARGILRHVDRGQRKLIVSVNLFGRSIAVELNTETVVANQ